MSGIQTAIDRSGHCERWDIDIQIRGYYELRSLQDSAAELIAYSCPIINNMAMPEKLKVQPFDQYPFCDMAASCPLLHDLPEQLPIEKKIRIRR